MSQVTLTAIPLLVPGLNINANQFHYNTALTGLVNGSNHIFSIPAGQFYINNLGITLQLMVNSIKQNSSTFVPYETGGAGTGFNAVNITIAPSSGTITADYVKTT